MKVKGWAQTGVPPPNDLTDDGASITFEGMSWQPLIDTFSLGIESIHFGHKKRGCYPKDLIRFNDTFGKTM